MANYLDFDELNTLVEYQFAEDKSKLSDTAEDLLILAYQRGAEDVQDMLDYFFYTDAIDVDFLSQAVNLKTKGKTALQRVQDYVDNGGSLAEIQRVVATECHRCYNNGAFDTANKVQNESGLIVNKTWKTMKDNRVRDTHHYLEGMTVRMGERFYTYDGASTEYPGQFGIPQEDINCRCVIEYSTESV